VRGGVVDDERRDEPCDEPRDVPRHPDATEAKYSTRACATRSSRRQGARQAA
jgi:hypothetical protein